MLRVLFVNENLGGHATLHLHLRAALRFRDDVAAEFVDVPRPSFMRRLASAPVPGLDRLDADLQPLRAQLAAAAWVRRAVERRLGSFDVLHVYSQNAALLLAPIIGSVPTVISTDSTNQVNGWALPYRPAGRFTAATVALTRRFEDPVLEAADLVVAQSRWIAGSLRSDYGIPEERLRLIPFGVTVPARPVRDPQEPPLVTFVGSSLARKGGDRLLDAFERLRSSARLVLVTPEPVRPPRGVTVIGDITPGDSRLDQLLARTSVFAFPSEIDKSSYAVLEAMAQGAAVLTTSVGALDELVEHGVTGVVVPPGDDAALLAALEALVSDPDRCEELGAAGRARLEKRFDAERTTDDLVEVLREAQRLRSAASATNDS